MAHKYYSGKLARGEIPPDICVEIALWDRFQWGPEHTRKFSNAGLRMLFAVLEQQRIDKSYQENVGGPDPDRMESLLAAQASEKAQDLR